DAHQIARRVEVDGFDALVGNLNLDAGRRQPGQPRQAQRLEHPDALFVKVAVEHDRRLDQGDLHATRSSPAIGSAASHGTQPPRVSSTVSLMLPRRWPRAWQAAR